MAKFSTVNNTLGIYLTRAETKLLGRPSFKLDKNRIFDVVLVDQLKMSDLGLRVTRRPLLGGLLGEYRNGSKKIIALGKASKGPVAQLKLIHPTIDEIWYSGQDAAELLASLKKK